MERYRSHLVWEAWTDIGSVGVGRIAVLTQIDNFRQIYTTPVWTPSTAGGTIGTAVGTCVWLSFYI